MQKLALIKRFGLVLFEAVLLVLVARLRILDSYRIHEPRLSFGDTHDYLIIASQSLASAQFWLSDKAFLIPLFFKILGSNPDLIFRVQLIFSILCWSVLAVTCAVVIRSYPLKLLVFVVVLGFSLSQQVILWDSLLLTESLHFSLAALFYSSALLLARRWQNANAAILIVLSALLGFARDTNAYMLLFAAAILFGLFLLFKEHRLRFLLIGGAFTAIFLVSASLASAGHHGNAALLNVLTGRILADKDYTSYMAAQGMPVSYLSLPGGDKAADWDPLWDPRLASLRASARDHGKPALIGFLWHFKADTLQKPLLDPIAVLAPNLRYYAATGFRPILEPTRFAELLYPMRFGVILFLAANLAAASLSVIALQQKKVMWLLPLLMILLSYPQIVFVWNSDPHDILRHSLGLNVQWRLGVWLLAFPPRRRPDRAPCCAALDGPRFAPPLFRPKTAQPEGLQTIWKTPPFGTHQNFLQDQIQL